MTATSHFYDVPARRSMATRYPRRASPKFESASQQYQELALSPDKQIYAFDGYLNGRVTTDDNQTHYRYDGGTLVSPSSTRMLPRCRRVTS